MQCALAVKESRQKLINVLEIVAESHWVTTEVAVEARGYWQSRNLSLWQM